MLSLESKAFYTNEYTILEHILWYSLPIKSKLLHFDKYGKKVYDKVLHSSTSVTIALAILSWMMIAHIGQRESKSFSASL